MVFKSFQEAEEYYFENLAKTNNMHDEEESALERWLENQEIEEREDFEEDEILEDFNDEEE